MINGTPDPGLPFFVALVVITATRARLRRERIQTPATPQWPQAAPTPAAPGA